MVFLHSSSKTTDGVWILSPPVLVVEKNNLNHVGRAVKQCLMESRDGVPHPKVFTGSFEPVLTLAGVKSYSTFVKSAKCMLIKMSGSEIVTFVPTRNEGARGGFSHLPNTIEANLVSDESLGAEAIAALSYSE